MQRRPAFSALTLNAGRQENTVKGTSIQGQASNNRGLFTSASFSASYEIDLWSRVRNTAQAAELQLQATRYELDAARITIAGQLATTWAQWVAADQTVRLFEQELENFRTNLNLVELRFRQGSALASDVLQQRQLVESAQGNLSQAISSRDVLHNSLSILAGHPQHTEFESGRPAQPATPASHWFSGRTVKPSPRCTTSLVACVVNGPQRGSRHCQSLPAT